MSNIFAGEAEFTTPRPFESSSARVKLSFTVTEGEDAAVVGINTGLLARRLAEQMISAEPGKLPEVTLTPTPTRRRAAPTQTVENVAQATATSDAATALSTGPSALPAASPSEAVQDPFAAGAHVPSEPASAAASETASNDPSKSSENALIAVTDAMLQDAIKAKVQADARFTQPVMELIQSFTNDPLAKIYTVEDQGKRNYFLAKLAEVK